MDAGGKREQNEMRRSERRGQEGKDRMQSVDDDKKRGMHRYGRCYQPGPETVSS